MQEVPGFRSRHINLDLSSRSVGFHGGPFRLFRLLMAGLMTRPSVMVEGVERLVPVEVVLSAGTGTGWHLWH